MKNNQSKFMRLTSPTGRRPERGLTLLELILSMTMLSIVLLGTTTLESSAARIQAGNFQVADLQNQLSYAARVFEKDWANSSLVMIDRMPAPATAPASLVQWYQWRLRPQGGNANGSSDISYEIDLRTPSSSVFRKTAGGVTTNLIPVGGLQVGPLQCPISPQNYLALWTSTDFKLWTLNLGLSTTLSFGKKAPAPGYGKSFLARTAPVMDCRSGTCV